VVISTPTAHPRGLGTPVSKLSSDLSYLKSRNPADVDNSGLPITPLDKLHLTGQPPETVDLTQYRLTVDGLVDTPLTLTYEELLAYDTTSDVALLICPGIFVDNALWAGVPVATLLNKAHVKAGAQRARFYAMDGYQRALPLDEILSEDGSQGFFLAYSVNGQVLPLEHGYPVRLVATGRFGNLWVKWVENISVE